MFVLQILEGQKDPPREKLFSVLGKIFKVTERNQENVPPTRQCVHDEVSEEPPADVLCGQSIRAATNQEGHDGPTSISQQQLAHYQINGKETKWSPDDKHNLIPPSSKCDQVELHLPEDHIEPAEGTNVPDAHSKLVDPAQPRAPNIPRCPSPDMASRVRGSKTWRSGDELIASSSVIYRSRYPSTMHSWDLRGGRNSIVAAGPCESIDFTAQWNELNALSESFSVT